MVDVYNVVSGEWTSLKLSEARIALAAAAYGTKIYFGGGAIGFDYTAVTGTVDVFELK